MTTMASPNGPMNLDAVTAQVKRLINAQLKQVCKSAGLPVSGAKAALQTRIIDRMFLLFLFDQYGSVRDRHSCCSTLEEYFALPTYAWVMC